MVERVENVGLSSTQKHKKYGTTVVVLVPGTGMVPGTVPVPGIDTVTVPYFYWVS